MPYDSRKRNKVKKRLHGYLKWTLELPRQSKAVSLSAAIDDITNHLGYQTRINEQVAVLNWDNVVGEQIAKVTSAKSIEQGILVVKVDNPAWRCELTYMKEDIRKKLNLFIGRPVVVEIKFC